MPWGLWTGLSLTPCLKEVPHLSRRKLGAVLLGAGFPVHWRPCGTAGLSPFLGQESPLRIMPIWFSKRPLGTGPAPLENPAEVTLSQSLVFLFLLWKLLAYLVLLWSALPQNLLRRAFPIQEASAKFQFPFLCVPRGHSSAETPKTLTILCYLISNVIPRTLEGRTNQPTSVTLYLDLYLPL